MKALLAILVAAIMSVGCATKNQPVTDRNSQLTHGNVQMKLKVGVTTQLEVLEAFGAPNITTLDGTGQEVWTYQRQATVSQSSTDESFFSILILGGARSSSGFEQTSRMMTLIIKFNAQKVVSEFKSMSSNF